MSRWLSALIIDINMSWSCCLSFVWFLRFDTFLFTHPVFLSFRKEPCRTMKSCKTSLQNNYTPRIFCPNCCQNFAKADAGQFFKWRYIFDQTRYVFDFACVRYLKVRPFQRTIEQIRDTPEDHPHGQYVGEMIVFLNIAKFFGRIFEYLLQHAKICNTARQKPKKHPKVDGS